jgi:hypothetical protein
MLCIELEKEKIYSPSGPTLNPKVDVTKDSKRSGKRWMLLDGKVSIVSEENAETKSATVNVACSFEERIPIRMPPRVHTVVIK